MFYSAILVFNTYVFNSFRSFAIKSTTIPSFDPPAADSIFDIPQFAVKFALNPEPSAFEPIPIIDIPIFSFRLIKEPLN